MQGLRIGFALTLCAWVAACDSPRSQLELHELAVTAQQIESVAGESHWLAEQLRMGNITQGMAWVHQKALGEDALKAAEDLNKSAPPSLRDSQRQVADLAARLQSQVTRIAPAADHPDELDALQREFDSIAKAVHPLAQQA